MPMYKNVKCATVQDFCDFFNMHGEKLKLIPLGLIFSFRMETLKGAIRVTVTNQKTKIREEISLVRHQLKDLKSSGTNLHFTYMFVTCFFVHLSSVFALYFLIVLKPL